MRKQLRGRELFVLLPIQNRGGVKRVLSLYFLLVLHSVHQAITALFSPFSS